MKYVLITGGSRGIGAAVARRLGAAGWGVAVNCLRRMDRAEELVRDLERAGVPAIAIQADVADPEQAKRLVDEAAVRFGRLDALVCNAGISHMGLISQISQEDWRRLFAVNVDGVHYCCRAALPYLLREHAGSIVTVSSMWGQVGASCEVAYSAAKGAVIAYTKALAKELGPSHIRVNCVAPGVVDTEMNAHLNPEDLTALAEETPLGRTGAPEEVANAVAFLVSDQASFITGQVLAVNGGFII